MIEILEWNVYFIIKKKKIYIYIYNFDWYLIISIIRLINVANLKARIIVLTSFYNLSDANRSALCDKFWLTIYARCVMNFSEICYKIALLSLNYSI